MRRKVIKQGNNTLTITLPREWTSKHGVKAGDELEMQEIEKGLFVGTESIASGGEVEIEIPAERFTRRPIIIKYIHGYDTIKVRFHDRESYNKIESFSNYLLGFEIVEQKPNYCVIKNVAKGMEGEFDTILNRLFLLTITTGHELLEALQKNDYSFMRDVEAIERNATKLDMFCRRMINIRNYKGKRFAASVYRINCIMEEITDIYRDIARFVLENKPSFEKDVLNFLKEAAPFIERFYSLYNKPNEEKIREFRVEEGSLSRKGIEIMKDKKGPNAVLMHYILSMIEKLHHASEELG